MCGRRVSVLAVGAAIAAFMFAFAAPAEAQGNDRKVRVGGKGGFTYSSLRIVDTDEDIGFEFGSDSGFAIGGVAAFEVHRNISVQPEGLYVRRKAELKSTFDDETATIETDYFDIPVLLKLHAEQSPGVRPFAVIGATFSFLLSAEAVEGAEAEDIKDDLESTDVGFTFGGGVDFIQDWGAVTVDVRYVLGLRKLVVDADFDDGNLKAGSFLFMGGVVF